MPIQNQKGLKNALARSVFSLFTQFGGFWSLAFSPLVPRQSSSWSWSLIRSLLSWELTDSDHFSGTIVLNELMICPHNCIRRCALSLLGRAHNVVNGGYLEDWIYSISMEIQNCKQSHDKIKQYICPNMNLAHFRFKHRKKVDKTTKKIELIWAFCFWGWNFASLLALFAFLRPFQLWMGICKVPRWNRLKILASKHPWKS